MDPAYGLQLHHPWFLEFVGQRCFGGAATSARRRPDVIQLAGSGPVCNFVEPHVIRGGIW